MKFAWDDAKPRANLLKHGLDFADAESVFARITCTFEDRRFDYDEQTFRFIFRVDGQPWWAAQLTPYKGTNTQSCFVALATRS